MTNGIIRVSFGERDENVWVLGAFDNGKGK